jgi:hypothetical protein
MCRNHARESNLPNQIRLLGLSAMIAVLTLVPAGAHEQPTTTPAAQFLQGTIDTALGLVHPPMTAKTGRDLGTLIHDSMDWPSLTQFAIGHYRVELDSNGMRGVRTRIQQQLDDLARRAGTQLPSMTLAVHDMRIDRDGNRHVLSIATLPRFGEIEVDWTLAPTAGGGYRISDIAAFGLTLKQFLRGWVTSLVAAQGGDAANTFAAPPNPASSPQ